MGRLDDTVAVVTGAAAGIGAACADRLAEEGATVVTLDVTGAVDHLADVRDEGAVKAAFASVMGDHGRLDALVHAAAAFGAGGPIHLLREDEWDRLVDVNLKGTFLVDKHAVIHMLAQGHGSIVNIGSTDSLEGSEGASAYNASKGGVLLLTKAIAVDYGRRGIRVNCICPGVTETPMLQSVTDSLRTIMDSDGVDRYWDRLRERTLLDRFAQPSELAAAAAFLCSDDASFITGHALVVDGGATAGLRMGLLDRLGVI
jgi:NAD(P)-dependent dehydrogenase (short-subunit alcohol dehydrogenase family)